jgi:hypothetical protein
MKPTTLTHKNAKKFPFVDYDYQATTLKNLSGCCARTLSKSLRDVSRNYFDRLRPVSRGKRNNSVTFSAQRGHADGCRFQ